MTFRKILVGFGGGDSSRAAPKLAGPPPRACGAELVIAHVPGRGDALREADAVLPYGATVELKPVKSRSVTQGLHELAEQEEADLIVVGSPERRPLHGLHAPASVAERLLHAA